jgi:hypothetical protein
LPCQPVLFVRRRQNTNFLDGRRCYSTQALKSVFWGSLSGAPWTFFHDTDGQSYNVDVDTARTIPRGVLHGITRGHTYTRGQRTRFSEHGDFISIFRILYQYVLLVWAFCSWRGPVHPRRFPLDYTACTATHATVCCCLSEDDKIPISLTVARVTPLRH